MSAHAELQDIVATLDALLRVRYADEADRARRDALALGYLSSEIRKSAPSVRTLAEVIDAAAALPLQDIAAIRSRCLYYGCDDLITLLVYRRIRSDAIAREEAVLYVQDRLQRDDFRRIRSFRPDRGASFVTYMWQVVNNLLLDFGRARGKHSMQPHAQDATDSAAAISGENDAEPGVEPTIEARQLHEMLVELMSENHDAAALHPVRERLRAHLNLSSKERVFLKALFQYELSMNEVRALPGFGMSVNEAYRFYYRIMDKLLDGFKAAGVLDSLRAQVSAAAPRVAMEIDGQQAIVAADRIHYLEHLDRRSTGCHADWQGGIALGTIAESFSKLSKRLAAYFTPIDATTAVADRILTAARSEWDGAGEFAIVGVRRRFRVGKRQLAALRQRFAENSSAHARTNERAS